MTLFEDKKDNIYEVVLKQVQDKLMEQPGLTSVEEVQQWLADFRGDWTVMLHLYGKLEKEMFAYQYQFIKQCPKEIYDRIKNSSTMITNMSNSMFPNYHHYVTMKELIKACLQVSPEYNTMLSNFVKQGQG